MKKSYKIIGVLILIVCILIGFSTVKNNKVEYAIELANNYLLEEKYEEAVLVFEDLPVIYENSKYKEAYVVVSTIRDAHELFKSGKYEEAQNLLEHIKNNGIFEVTDKVVEKIEIDIKIETEKRGLGNSPQNSRNGGLVAYEDVMVYFANLEDGGKLYRKNLKTDETVKISDELATNINIYGDKIYFSNSGNIKCVSKDGSGTVEKVVDCLLIRPLNYIVDDELYYFKYQVQYQDGNEYLESIERLNLKTGECYTTKAVMRYGECIINKKENGNLEMYYQDFNGINRLSNNDSINVFKKDLDVELLPEYYYLDTNLFGVYNGELYHTVAGYDDKSGKNKILKTDVTTGESKELIHLSDEIDYSTGIIGDKYLYLVSDEGTVYSVDLKTEELATVKIIDKLYIPVGERFCILGSDQIFEVNGYLAYYNSLGKLIIDKEVQILDLKHQDQNLL